MFVMISRPSKSDITKLDYSYPDCDYTTESLLRNSTGHLPKTKSKFLRITSCKGCIGFNVQHAENGIVDGITTNYCACCTCEHNKF